MTKILKQKLMTDSDLIEIATSLKEGKLVVFPTDTVYGIGTNVFNEKACQKIYEVKGRPQIKPLSVLISDISMLSSIATINPLEQKLIDAFWPGPLTIKLKKKNNMVPDIVSAKDEYIRVRLIKDGLTSKIIQFAGVPIVAPSANLSGSPTGTKIANVIAELGNKVDYVIDCGDIEDETTSTIVQVENESIKIIREGKIKKEEIERIHTNIEEVKYEK